MKFKAASKFLVSEHHVSTGKYLVTQCCVDCDWFRRPLTPNFIVPGCCPKCGGKLKRRVGRYIIEHVPGFLWFGGKTNIIGFDRKCVGDMPKMTNKKEIRESTKICPHCGCNKLILLSSQNTKICNNCGAHIPWFLEPGQKSIL